MKLTETLKLAEQEITFQKLLHPMTPAEFFAGAYGRSAVHVPGDPIKFANVFSWGEFNRLLNQTTLWSDRSMKMVLSGRNLTPQEFCRPGHTREGNQAMLPDPERVTGYLQQGATLILDLVERLSPGIAAVATSLEMVVGNPAVCNAYCSWSAHQGFPAHFDSSDVFALHIEGQKIWRLYEGRFVHPVELPGFSYETLPAEQRARARGKVLKEVVMNPGDMLYIPRGQYHDALASSDACLHLSFGLVPRTGHDFLRILLRSLPDEPLFRQALPHFDDVQAYETHLTKLAERLYELMIRPATAEQARQDHRQRAFRDSLRGFTLPVCEPATFYRVRWRHGRLVEEDDRIVLKSSSAEHELVGDEARLAQWILRRDYFDTKTLANTFDRLEQARLTGIVEKLMAAGLIEPL